MSRLSDISVELAEGLAQNTLSKVDETGVIAVELGVPAEVHRVSKRMTMKARVTFSSESKAAAKQSEGTVYCPWWFPFLAVRIEEEKNLYTSSATKKSLSAKRRKKFLPDNNAHLVVLIVGGGAPVLLVLGIGLAATVVKDGDLRPRKGRGGSQSPWEMRNASMFRGIHHVINRLREEERLKSPLQPRKEHTNMDALTMGAKFSPFILMIFLEVT